MTGLAAARNLGLRNLSAVGRWSARAALLLAFLIAGGAFSLQLSGLDPHASVGADSASFRSKLSLGLAFATMALFGVAARRRLFAQFKANALLLALPALAMISAVWAPEHAVSLRRAAAFTATVLSGFAVSAYSPGAKALRFIAQAVFAAVLLSIAYALLRPEFGLHQLTDGVQSVHAGDWRGVFIHRTMLGRLAALSLALAIYSDAVTGLGARIGLILAFLLCLVMAHSAGGFGSAAILLATPLVLRLLRTAVRRGGVLAIAIFVLAMAAAALIAWMLGPALLQLLGKDATLTGRTEFWRLMLQAAAQRPFLGYGYSTGFRTVVARLVEANSPYGYVPNAQNGYLDVTLNLGLAGLALSLAILGVAAMRAFKLALASQRLSGDAVAPLIIVVFIIEMNVVEAALISANDIFVLIFTTAVIASGEMLADRRRFAINHPRDDDEGQIDRQRLQS